MGGLTNKFSTSYRYSATYPANEKIQAIECILIFINFTRQRFGLTEHGIPPHRQALAVVGKLKATVVSIKVIF
jgi:hypothetical protein